MADDFNPFALGAKTAATVDSPAPQSTTESDFDPFRDGGAKVQVAAKPASFLAPRNYVMANDPDAHWRDLYAGLQGLDNRVDPEQKKAFSLLSTVTTDPEEDRARAINQAFLGEKLGLSGPALHNNWEATKVGFAKEQLGVEAEKLSDKQIYSWIGARLGPKDQTKLASMADVGEITAAGPKPELTQPWTWGGEAPLTGDWYRAKQSVSKLWESLNHSMIDKIPDPPANLPDIVVPGSPMFISPAVAAGVWTGAVKPILSGLTSPAGIATVGIGTELHALSKAYPLAKAALVGMTGGFAAWMGYGAAQAIPEARRVLSDPKSTTQEKVAAVAAPVSSAVMASMAALGTAFAAMPERAPKVAESMAGKRPGEVAELLKQEAVTAPPDVANALHQAATHFDEVAAYDGGPEQWEAAAHPQERIASAAIKTPDGNVAEGLAHDAIREELTAYHGTPNTFSEFDAEKIGTGEGNQSYGHGLYFTESEAVAGEYLKGSPGEKKSGNVYKVAIKAGDSDLLDWDKPLREQSPKVQEALKRLAEVAPDKEMAAYVLSQEKATGGYIYKTLAGMTTDEGPSPQASKMLSEIGIAGIKYIADGVHSKGEGTKGLVIFDPASVKILENKSASPEGLQEGFVTSSGRFVDKVEARQIAEAAGQIVEKPEEISAPSAQENAPTQTLFHQTTAKFEDFKEGADGYLYFSDKPDVIRKMRKAGQSPEWEKKRLRTIKADVTAEKPLDLRKQSQEDVPAEAWLKILEDAGVRVPDGLRQKASSGTRLGVPLWQVLKAGGAELKSAIRAAGYDSVRFEEWGGTTTAVLSKEQVKIVQPKKGVVEATPAERNPDELHSSDVNMAKPSSAFGQTSLKNSYDELERVAYGFDEAPPTEKQNMAEANARAAEIDSKDPGAGQRLAEAMKANPNIKMDGDKWAMLLRYKAQLSAALNQAAGVVMDSGASAEMKAAAKTQMDEASAKLLDLMNARRVVISESGRDLRWQQAIMHEDYSFSSQEMLLRAAKGGAELTEPERAALQTRIDELQKRQAELEKHIAQQTSVSHTQAADQAVKAMRRAPQGPRKFVAAERVRERLSAKAQESMKYLYSGKLFSIGPDVLYHMSVIGADRIYSAGLDFTKWSTAMVETLGEKVKPVLAEVWDASRKLFHAENRQGLIEELKSKPEADRASFLPRVAQELAREQIDSGVKERDAIVDAVHAELEKAVPGISRREAMDAISGYGKFKPLSRDQISAELGDLKGQLLQIAKIEDLSAGKTPKKTGVEHRSPSEEEKALRKQVSGAEKMNEVKLPGEMSFGEKVPKVPGEKFALPGEMDFGEKIPKGAKDKFELPGSMDFGKTSEEIAAEATEKLKGRLEQQIADLERQIESRTKDVRENRGTVYDDEANRLKLRRDELKEQFDGIFGRKELTDAQRLNIWKAYANRRIGELNERLANQDFAPKPKAKPLAFDEEANRLRGELERAKQDFAIARHEAEEAAKPKWQKALSEISGAARASALSGYHTLAKLAAFSFFRFAETPVTEGLGAMLRRVPGISEIAAKANLESGAEYEGLAKFYSRAAMQGMRDAWETLQPANKGKSSLKAELADARLNEGVVRWDDYFGISHMALKSPLLRGEFELRLTKAYQHAITNGIDVTDPLVSGALRKEAFDYAQRAILQENNQFSDWINSLTNRLEAANPKVGKTDVTKAVISAFIKTFLTKGIVKTPSNYIWQTLERTPLGIAKGTAQAVVAHIQGVEKLTPEEANTIMRLLKVGSVGSAMFIFGAIDATKDPKDRVFGGYYQAGDKRGDTDVGWGKIRIGGTEFPHLLTHNPLTEVGQMGSTFMRVMKSRVSKKDAQDRGALAGSVAAIMALASEAPIVNPVTQQAEAVARGEGNKIVWDAVAGLVPQLVQNVASDLDGGKSRKAENFTQRMEMTLPVVRENVPETKAQKKRDIKERLKKP